MEYKKIISKKQKSIALVAHDNMKKFLINWILENKEILKDHKLCGTGTTSKMIEAKTGLKVHSYKSGPIGGDQQIGAKIVDGEIDFMIFFWDPLEAQPHDPDVKALLRIGVLYNIPIANNISTADFLLSSNLLNTEYNRVVIDYDKYINKFRKLD